MIFPMSRIQPFHQLTEVHIVSGAGADIVVRIVSEILNDAGVVEITQYELLEREEKIPQKRNNKPSREKFWGFFGR